MPKEIEIRLPIEQVLSQEKLLAYAAKHLNVNETEIKYVKIKRKSIDARQKIPVRNIVLIVYSNIENVEELSKIEFHNVANAKPVHIIGAGPAGLFAAVRLIEKGFKPIIFERGQDVTQRKIDIADMYKTKLLNYESNYCFGEGGAGAFSDGKLYTRSNKRGSIDYILNYLVENGASPEITYNAHPHIGSDKLPTIIKSIRQNIISAGGEIHFNSKLDDLFIADNKINAISINKTKIDVNRLILATGHSANDIYNLLLTHKIEFEAKPLAIGVRVEHPQALINDVQYHYNYNPDYMEPATYSFVEQVNKRGVFSFCMCPGGYIIPSATSRNKSVVNGMSNAKRNGEYANAGIVVSINLDDIKSYIDKFDQMAMLFYRNDIEQAFSRVANDELTMPAQNIKDFMNNRVSQNLYESSYLSDLIPANINDLFPSVISSSLKEAFRLFEKKMKGFIEEGIIIGAETRTSSPIKISRKPDILSHIRIENLYPCGEGAGYAGGITSSAIDGVNIVDKLIIDYK